MSAPRWFWDTRAAAAAPTSAPAPEDATVEPSADAPGETEAPPSAAASDPVRSCITKKRYGTAELARHVAAQCMRERRTPLRVYPCELCGGFHLTKRDAVERVQRAGWRPAASSKRDRAKQVRQRERILRRNRGRK